MSDKNNNYEKNIQKFWKENKVYDKLKEKNKGGKKFNHIDGPPYPTGEVHLGHLRNWVVKDSVLRFKMLQGYDVYAKDGYDAHGLPVENQVEKKLGLKTVDDLKKFGEENFVYECKKYVNEIIDDMANLRDRFGLWMDRNAYYTFHPDYLSLSWRFFKEADKQGLLYKDYKTVAWCPHDQTTLSDYEIKDTYKEITDPSIYVKFKVDDDFITTDYKESFLVWTTTPWTLQSNMLIAVKAEFDYSYVLVELNGKKEVFILADLLVDKIIEKLSKQNDIKLIKILKTVKGSELESIKYKHFYIDETPSQKEFIKQDIKNLHSIVLADFVTLDEGEDVLDKLKKKGYKHEKITKEEEQELSQTNNNKKEGTGLVHIAPGHGFDDYDIGRKYNVPIFCPVGVDGKFTEGKYENVYFKEVDPIAIDYLKEKGNLLYIDYKTHKYPCCWRCKTPIVYRAADQWWIRRSDYIEKNIKDNQNVSWYPKSTKIIFDNLMKNAGDWAISRQRYWGTPLPIFEDEDGNYEVFGSKEELEERIGYKLEDIHRDDLKKIEILNKKSGKVMKSVPFIADVWFDSGCASFASHYGEGLTYEEIIDKYYPINWVTESEDQIRGWFSSLFNVGQVITGKAPYNQVLYYRFIMDKHGQKMSKSLGNGITGNECIERFGADKTRYYLSIKKAPEEQINFDVEEFNIVDGFFNTLENLVKYMNSYLKEHKLNKSYLNTTNLKIEDKWILYRLNKTIELFTFNFEKFKINIALKELEDFVVRDLSKTYLKIVKERTEERDENLLIIFNEVLKKILLMLSPIIPFKVEDLYQKINFEFKKESCFYEFIPEADELLIKEVETKKINENFQIVQEIIQAVLNAREKAQIGLRWPLPEINIVSSMIEKEEIKLFEDLIKYMTNIKSIKYDIDMKKVNYIIKPDFKAIKEDFNDIKEIITLINQNKYYINNDLKNLKQKVEYDGIKIDLNKHIIKEMELESDLISSEFKLGHIILHTVQDEILLEEGFIREIIRRIQQMRKELNLEKSDRIKLSFLGSENYIIDLIDNFKAFILKKVGADEITDNKLNEEKEFYIKDKKIIISIEK